MSIVKARKPLSLSMILTTIFSALLFLSAVHGAESELPLSLFRAIDERLGYMEDVALFKAQNRIPVEDIEREEFVLSAAKELAASHGLDPKSMERFFIAQIGAAKAIQYRYRAELLTREIPTRSVDLQSNSRPALDRLGNDIVMLFSTLLESRSAMGEESRERFMSTLQSRLLADAEREALFDAMLQVRRSQ
ncbi:MAG: chorismate mutase AroQ, gamma subclass [SAR86 cluster bacterium]|uniref:chorismate mutase n=1 Tax=SAR86 cluster bacterium TaxID=2030880 RepID=A0A2A4X5C0_9GAMM|nr:MAG: chorismate mutase AroQ, gamma subclass [SAR86 cluster bacterium]